MIRGLLIVSLALLSVGPVWGAEPEDQKVAPIPAEEAESCIVEARDFLTNMFWENTEQYWHKGDWDSCIRLCRQIVELDPQFVEAYTSAAWMLWNLERDEEAIEVFEAAIEDNPDRYEPYHEFGMYYWQRHQWAKAAEQFRSAVEAEAPRALQHMLPHALERMGELEEAVAEWRAIQKRFPDDPIPERHIDRLEQEIENHNRHASGGAAAG